MTRETFDSVRGADRTALVLFARVHVWASPRHAPTPHTTNLAPSHPPQIYDEATHAASVLRGDRRLSYRATQAALLITLYSREPILHLPARVLSALMDVDEMLTLWRHRHALMVHRMLGVKVGTGGSSGYHYLRATAERHKVFGDLLNLSTFLLPSAALPPLPDSVRDALAFSWRGAGAT